MTSSPHFYTLSTSTSSLRLTVTDYGARVVALEVPDSAGNLRDIALGFPDAASYLADEACFGGVLGRNANRIENARFALAGHEYHLVANEGANSNHSGPDGFEKRVWEVSTRTESSITFALQSAAGDQGFPGSLDVNATYTLVGEVGLELTIHGLSDAPTVFNPTTHTYFNLNGVGAASTIEQHLISVSASNYCPTDETTYIPHSAVSVAETPMDLRTKTRFGEALESARVNLGIKHGFNHAYLIDDFHEGKQSLVAKAASSASGITMTMTSDAPAVLLYSADYLDGIPGKYGIQYGLRAGFCLEPGFVPNSINDSTQIQPVLSPCTPFAQRTRYQFGTR